jgi:acetyl esterase/lipase
VRGGGGVGRKADRYPARARRPLLGLLASLCLLLLIGLIFQPTAGSQQGFSVYRDVPYAMPEGRKLRLDAYVPDDGINPGVVVLFEGGWVSGNKRDWRTEGERLAAEGLAAFVIDYRLSPPGGTAHAPAAVEDVRAAISWVRTNAAIYRVDPTKVGALGGSAGGHLAMMAGTTGGVGQDRADAVVSWSGDSILRLFTSGPEADVCLSFIGCPLGDCPGKWDVMSPLYQVDSSAAPMYLANSTDEDIPLEQATLMADRLQEAGVPHVLQIVEGREHSRGYENEAFEPSVQFLKTYLGTAAGTL